MSLDLGQYDAMRTRPVNSEHETEKVFARFRERLHAAFPIQSVQKDSHRTLSPEIAEVSNK